MWCDGQRAGYMYGVGNKGQDGLIYPDNTVMAAQFCLDLDIIVVPRQYRVL
jgi:hypothetical protein